MISVEQFRICLQNCFLKLNYAYPKSLAIALSGGVDSMCLAHLTAKYKQVYQHDLQLYSITIDHAYRPESKEEADKVAHLAQKLGINSSVVRLQYAQDVAEITNFEETARTLRYSEFNKFCHENSIEGLLVAHNLDDQVETFIQRLRQNSSLYGLAGLKMRSTIPVQPKGPDVSPVPLFRPLLSIPKSELIDTCHQNLVPWFEDPTNKDASLTERNFWRSKLKEVPKNAHLKQDELLDSIREVNALVSSFQTQAASLKHHVFGSDECEYSQNGSLTFNIEYNVISDTSMMVFSRFLYQILYPVSASRDYHWMYAKLERQAVPKIDEHIKKAGRNPILRLTYLNILMTIKREGKMLNFHFERQPIAEGDKEKTILNLNANEEWKLFDNRFWIQLNANSSTSYSVVPYDPKHHKKLIIDAFPELKKVKGLSKRLKMSPIITSDQFLAVPVLQKVRSTTPTTVNISLKQNIFSNA